MKRISIVLILTLILLSGCTKANDKTQQDRDFGFTLKYGVGAKNELNTFEGTFTKDLVIAGTATTGLHLSNTELNQIYEEMLRIHIMDYPEIFKESRNSMVMITPFQTYAISININGQRKRIYWEDENVSDSKKATQLRALLMDIIQIIESKKEYKKSPPIEGGYC